ncbi:MAG: sodium ion-translocating decarboxylase subunit beta [Micropruina sp.]
MPIGAGAILANLPLSPMVGPDGLLTLLYETGVASELFPLLIFIGIGAMTDRWPAAGERRWCCCWAPPGSSASS